jgi:phospholipid-binding lipoprotein MlaA
MTTLGRILVAGSLALAVSGCASQSAATSAEAYDPLQPVNRVFYRVNDLGDRYILRPVAVGYSRALPAQVRTGVRNFFSNLLYPVTIANAFLQGKFQQSGRDGARFLLNSTVGLGGLFDPASRVGLTENDEDFGQTLAVWGVGDGPYLVIPIFGPSTVRNAVGDIVDAPLTPFLNFTDGDLGWRLGAWAIYQVDGRSGLLDADDQVFEAYDPYIFVRDAYLQNRLYRSLDGNVPEDDSYLDDSEFDDPEDYAPETAEPAGE